MTHQCWQIVKQNLTNQPINLILHNIITRKIKKNIATGKFQMFPSNCQLLVMEFQVVIFQYFALTLISYCKYPIEIDGLVDINENNNKKNKLSLLFDWINWSMWFALRFCLDIFVICFFYINRICPKEIMFRFHHKSQV